MEMKILDGGKNAKIKTLESKIRNIEKAAVLYGQDNRNKINKLVENTDDIDVYKYCFKSGVHINNCYYYEIKEDKNDNGTIEQDEIINTITVEDLAGEGYIKYDTEDNEILNSYDDNQTINECKIQIYQKYGKIYAVYDINNNVEVCWYE